MDPISIFLLALTSVLYLGLLMYFPLLMLYEEKKSNKEQAEFWRLVEQRVYEYHLNKIKEGK